jgi:hypothetical protein
LAAQLGLGAFVLALVVFASIGFVMVGTKQPLSNEDMWTAIRVSAVAGLWFGLFGAILGGSQ